MHGEQDGQHLVDAVGDQRQRYLFVHGAKLRVNHGGAAVVLDAQFFDEGELLADGRNDGLVFSLLAQRGKSLTVVFRALAEHRGQEDRGERLDHRSEGQTLTGKR